MPSTERLWLDDKLRTFGRDFAAISIARIIMVVLQLGYVKLYTISLSNHHLGIYALWCTLSYILNAAVFVPLDYYQQANIYPLRAQGKSLMGLIHFNLNVLKWVGLLSAVVILAIIPFRCVLASYIVAAVGLAVTTYAANALRGALNNLEHKQLVALLQVFEAFSKVFVLFVLIRLTGASALQVIGSQLITFLGVIVLMVWLCWRMRIFTVGKPERVNPRDTFNFCYPISIGALVNLAQLQGYRLLLTPLGFTEMIGIYFGISQVGASGMGFLAAIYAQVFTPTIYKSYGGYIREYLRYALILIGSVLLFSLFFSRPLVILLTKPEFGDHSFLILYGIAAEGGNLLIGGLSVYMAIRGKTVPMLWGTLLTAITSLLLTWAIYLLGAMSLYTIGLPVVLSQVIAVLYIYAVYRKERLSHDSPTGA